MSYDEFSEKLNKIQAEYLRTHGRKLETIKELEMILTKRMVVKKSRGLRSLKGIIP